MIVKLTRDSVCAADDSDAPNLREFSVDDGATLKDVMKVVRSRCLAYIHGGKATWIAYSIRPVAVLAQQWEEPRMVASAAQQEFDDLDFDGTTLRLHIAYRAQNDPESVFRTIGNAGTKTFQEP